MNYSYEDQELGTRNQAQSAKCTKCGNTRHHRAKNVQRLREQGMQEVHDSVQYAGITEGRRKLASDLCW